jgi:sterol desaturase/sphingolipid hydroxylase (fatty acid hydroxylase superfamily)
MILNGVISMFIAAGFALSQLNNGAMGELSDNIFPFDCWMFGVANLLVSFIFYIVFTFTLKWWSRDAKHVPFL